MVELRFLNTQNNFKEQGWYQILILKNNIPNFIKSKTYNFMFAKQTL